MAGGTSLLSSLAAAVLVVAALSGCARCVECTGTEVAPMPRDEDGNRIPRGEGVFEQFYGKNHEEVGGLFNRQGIAGAFAAKRDAGGPPAPPE